MVAIRVLLILALSTIALGNPLAVAEMERRQCVDTCGSTCYYQSDIDDAVNQGCDYLQRGQTVGSGGYPHVYNDYEGFGFPDAGPYYEFPVLGSYVVYTGGSPGPDRVIFTKACVYEGVITHTGASGNDFLQCRAD